MRRSRFAIAAAALSLFAQSGSTPRVRQTVDEVARPGGRLPGNPKIALVKVAGGFYDPTAGGLGRIIVTERVDRMRVVHKDERPYKIPPTNPSATANQEQLMQDLAAHSPSGGQFLESASVDDRETRITLWAMQASRRFDLRKHTKGDHNAN